MDGIAMIFVSAATIVIALFGIGLILSRLYRRASKEVSFVRTGFGGQKVIVNGGALVFPVLHETIPVNMNTLRLEVRRSNEQALITRDRMRVDVEAEFYVRVKPTEEAIADAAQTLGKKTLNPSELKQLVEGKFVDALRSVAAEMTMEELHEKRVDFVQKVQLAVTEDLLKNGLELESVSLTGLDQTSRDFFNPDNAFDAQGLTKLTEEIEARKKLRNDIEQDTAVAIQKKNLEAEKISLAIKREEEYARLDQQREVEVRRAEQLAQIAAEQAAKNRDAEEARISAQQKIDLTQIQAERAVEEERIHKDQIVKERDIAKNRSIETADIERLKTIELAKQEQAIAIAEKSKQQSESEAQADKARALAVKAEEEVVTVREIEIADRRKKIELVEAAKEAERLAIQITVQAESEKRAALDLAESTRLKAQGEADAEKLVAEAAKVRYEVEAEGKRSINEASNVLSAEQIAMQIKLAIVENLPKIVEQTVKPMERIDGIKIIKVDGLTNIGGGVGSSSGSMSTSGGNLADEVVSSALRYRAQQPLVDSLLEQIGLRGGDMNGMTAPLVEPLTGKTSADQPLTDGHTKM